MSFFDHKKTKITLHVLLAGFSGIVCARLREERPIVVVTACYNNAQWYERNLDSIFTQEYGNFRVICVDDGSIDGTGDFIEAYIKEHGVEDRITFIRNKKRRRKLVNIYTAIHLCDDNEIVVLVDGDDWLANQWVLKRINREYDNCNVWLTYGQYRNVPVKEAHRWGFSEKGYCAAVPSRVKRRKRYRRYRFLYMHPRSFYAWLFKLVKLEDLIAETVKGFKGDFYPAANDLAMLYPMVEMAHTRIKFISEVLYIRNLYSDIVGFKVDSAMQVASAREIRRRRHYGTLKKPVRKNFERFYQKKADLCIVCSYDLTRLPLMLESIHNNVNGLGAVYVLYVRNITTRTVTRSLKDRYKHVCFVPYHQKGNLTLHKQLLSCLRGTKNNYVMLATDIMQFIQPFEIPHLIYWLEKTYAHGFYLTRDGSFGKVPRHIRLADDICAWKFMFGKGRWHKSKTPNDIVLYRKEYVRKELMHGLFKTVEELDHEIKNMRTHSKKVGLFFMEQKVVPISG